MKSVQSARTNYRIAYATHEGMSGKGNEDSLGVFAWKLSDQSNVLMGIVADGVGGQIAGEVASRVTVDAVKDYFDAVDRASNINAHLERSIIAANKDVYKASLENPDYRGMSTTVAVAAVVNDRLHTAYVGDSRIYLVRDGRMRQISVDHTWAQEAIEAGLLTREQAKQHPNRNVIRRHLGGQGDIEVDHRLVLEAGQSTEEARANQGMSLKKGDTILICSDGLTDMINDNAVADSLATHFEDLETAANELVDKANQAGGKDNITLVILQMPGGATPKAIIPVSQDGETATTTAVSQKAAPAPAATARPVVATTAPAEVKAERSRMPWLLIGIVALFLVVASAVGAFVIFGGGDDEVTTPEPPTEIPVVATQAPLDTPQGAATAAVINPTDTPEPAETVESGEATGTPALIPTLRPTATNTATPTWTPIPTATNTATPQPQAPPPSTGPKPTPKPKPTSTDRPPDT